MKTVIIIGLTLFLALTFLRVRADGVPMSEMTPVSARQDYGSLELDRSVQGNTLTIGGREFARGLGTHANSKIIYDLDGHGARFEAWVGVDAEMSGHTESSVVFQVFGDGKKLFDSGVMGIATPAQRVSVELKDVKELALVVTDAGDGINCDHADWADAMLLADAALMRPFAQPATDDSPKYEVKAKGIAIKLSANGKIVAVAANGHEQKISGETSLAGCVQVGEAPAEKRTASGRVAFRRTFRHIVSGRNVAVVDRFEPAGDSIRWEIELVSDGQPWTTSITTQLGYPATMATRFWTAWSDPDHKDGAWRDPLVLRPFANAAWNFGGSTTSSDLMALPLATIAEPADDVGLSLVFSPEDKILCGSRLTTTSSGLIRFSRANYRLAGGKPLRFSMNLISHEADWRGGLRWMAARYPEFFDPPNREADAMAGCGAYSGDEDPVDAAKLRKMGFRINWKMSDDFPYMGMFIPPVKNADEKWERSCDEKAPPDKPSWTTCRRLNDYAHYMKTNGFYVLNYFNVTEFGKNMGGAPAREPGDPDLWKDPRAFLPAQFPGAILLGGSATYYGASVVDPGDPTFRKFILAQADRQNRLVPDSSGICIDRLDWLERSNVKADDGLSWIEGKPARSLCVSWKDLLTVLGPKMHRANKVIFVNPIYSRLDLLQQVDGIYTEFGQDGRSFNGCALMGLRKPVMAWSYNETLWQPDPDSFFQRHLLLGVYPTAPYPWNNHCINPERSADEEYLDYGPLLEVMRGKKWVLAAHCVEVEGQVAKANLFQVPGGYALPVTFGGKSEFAGVVVRNVPGLGSLKCSVIHPGIQTHVPLKTTFLGGVLTLRVPLQRGCAMVLLNK